MNVKPIGVLSVLVALVTFAGCAGYAPSGVRNGQTADEVVRLMGAPTGRHVLAGGGERLEYARGPMGKHTFMIDLDSGGRVTGWNQVLTEANFNSLPIGITREELLMRLGRPSERFHIGWQDLDVWAYRYNVNECVWFMVSLGRDARVHDKSYGLDSTCDVNEMFSLNMRRIRR